MKKTIISGCIILTVFMFGFSEVKTYKTELTYEGYQIYFRNVDRLNYMAGRNITNTDLLLATKDTVAFFTQLFVGQIEKQVSDTLKKK